MNYVPKCNFNFSLDLKLMSFRPSYSLFKEMNLTEILKTVQQNEISNQKTINNTIKQLHKQNFDNRYSEGNIPGEIDENGEWKPLIEYDTNKW